MNKKKVSVILFPYVFYVNNKISKKKEKSSLKTSRANFSLCFAFLFPFFIPLPILLLTVDWLVPVIVSFKYTLLLLLLLLYLTKKSACCQKHTQVMSPPLSLFISSLSVSVSIASAASGQKQAEATSHTLHAGAAERTGALL